MLKIPSGPRGLGQRLEQTPLGAPGRSQHCRRLISDVWPPELCGQRTCLLFHGARSVRLVLAALGAGCSSKHRVSLRGYGIAHRVKGSTGRSVREA